MGKPIKILHFADLHLGIENYGRTDPATGLNQRILDFLRTLKYTVDYAIEEKVGVVIFAGDAYKNRKPSPTLQREFAREIKRLTKAGIQILLLVGNHDLPHVEKHAHSLAVFDALEVEGVTVARYPNVYPIETPQGLIQIAALPHFSRSKLLTTPTGADDSRKVQNETIAKNIELFIDDLAKTINPDLPAILTGHLNVATAKLSTEQSIMIGDDYTVLPSVLARKEFNYIALGHIHRYQNLNDGFSPPLVYSGSLDRIDFGEENEKKGFVIAEISNSSAKFKFEETPARRFLSLDINCKVKPTEEALAEIRASGLKNAIVRVKLRVPHGLKDQLDLVEITKALKDCYYLAYIQLEIIGEERNRRLPSLTEAKTPLSALEEYLKIREDLTPLKDKLVKRAEQLLRELEV